MHGWILGVFIFASLVHGFVILCLLKASFNREREWNNG